MSSEIQSNNYEGVASSPTKEQQQQGGGSDQKSAFTQNNNNNNNNNDEEERYDVEQVRVTQEHYTTKSFPITVSGIHEINSFIKAGVLKSIENAKLRERYAKLITSERASKLVPLIFWFVFCAKFPACMVMENAEDFLVHLRGRMSKKYVKIFSELAQPKDELVNYLIYSLGYMTHHLFYALFPAQRFYFDLRFVLDCYHIIIFELNGLYVSDFYVRLNIERIFNGKFLAYENKNRPKKKLINAREKKNFLGMQQLHFKELGGEDGIHFQREVADRLKVRQKPVAAAHEDFAYKELLRDNLEAKMGAPARHQPQQEGGQNSSPNYERHNASTTTTAAQAGSALLSGTQSRKPYFGNLRLNCNQISPSVCKVLAYPTMSLPFAKRKMIRHVFENVADSQDRLMQQLSHFGDVRGEQKESRQERVQQKSMIDRYNLRVPNREYYQIHDIEKFKALFPERANMYDNLNKMFKGMLDLNYVFQHHRHGLQELQSSQDMLARQRVATDPVQTAPNSAEILQQQQQQQIPIKDPSEEQEMQSVLGKSSFRHSKRLIEDRKLVLPQLASGQPQQTADFALTQSFIDGKEGIAAIANKSSHGVSTQLLQQQQSIGSVTVKHYDSSVPALLQPQHQAQIKSPVQGNMSSISQNNIASANTGLWPQNNSTPHGRDSIVSILHAPGGVGGKRRDKLLTPLGSENELGASRSVASLLTHAPLSTTESYHDNRSINARVIDHMLARSTHMNSVEDVEDNAEARLRKRAGFDGADQDSYRNRSHEYLKKYSDLEHYQNHDKNIQQFKSRIQELQNQFQKNITKIAKK